MIMIPAVIMGLFLPDTKDKNEESSFFLFHVLICNIIVINFFLLLKDWLFNTPTSLLYHKILRKCSIVEGVLSNHRMSKLGYENVS